MNGWLRSTILIRILKNFLNMPNISNGKIPDENSSEEDVIQQKEITLERKFTTSKRQAFADSSPVIRRSFSDRHSSVKIEGLELTNFENPRRQSYQQQEYRIFVGTWNVGGRSPNGNLNLEDFLQIEGASDVYILGFQEIVPLNAGNVLVVEDSEPAAKWLALISQVLNKPQQQQQQHDVPVVDSLNSTKNPQSPANGKECWNLRLGFNKEFSKSQSGLLFFQRPSLKVLSKSYNTVDGAALKICNCTRDPSPGRRKARDMKGLIHRVPEFGDEIMGFLPAPRSNMNYVLVSSKQMVGIFLTVWVRSELVQYVGHLRTCSIGRGILNCLGNKGCIAVSFSLHQTSFCFVCSHLTSGEREGDELKRNSDIAEILRCTQFSKICKSRVRRIPEKILEHDRVIWLGDLNYRVSLSYEEARALLEEDNKDALLKKDQLRKEREAGRVFKGWKEGKIDFAPTYKYSQNSDSYAGENTKSKKKRRTPAWCDRILWYGEGMEQLSYNRGESRFSDHRPVFAVFCAQVELLNRGRCTKGFMSVGARMGYEDYVPEGHSSYEY